ncbi:hypothetical protein [Paraburkholderia unamae]|uniref:Uncharacterized protein n=1 Tax=Paraburkholderia unamae TaxID=219649 RepID=A0ABX5KU86_9BURK|nr:hypothetical protein [Paraburkholderia unamae]PVX85819.1 hypothetical protein C7402_103397 [Paraburkholderia unamae]
MQKTDIQELPAGLVVFTADGAVQFGWRHPETGDYHAESDGSCIAGAVVAVPWCANVVH